MNELVERLAALVRPDVRRALGEAVRGACGGHADPGAAWLDGQTEGLADYAVRVVVEGASGAAGAFARQAQDQTFWQAAHRAEREHQANLNDLAAAGLLGEPRELAAARGGARLTAVARPLPP